MNENETEVKPSPLRASNTVSTLRPVEVNASFPIPEEGITGNEQAAAPNSIADISGVYVQTTGLAASPRMKENFETISKLLQNHEVQDQLADTGYQINWPEIQRIQKELSERTATETVPSPEQQQTLFGLPEGDFESGFADDHCFAYTPDKEESVLSRRISRLEEQVDGILDRLAKFSIRASHKI